MTTAVSTLVINWLLEKKFIKSALSKFKVRLLAMNHLFKV